MDLCSNKNISDKSKKCLSVGNFRILSVGVCSASTAFTSLCRGPNYLLNVRYIIIVYPNVAGFLFFETLCLVRSATLPYI